MIIIIIVKIIMMKVTNANHLSFISFHFLSHESKDKTSFKSLFIRFLITFDIIINFLIFLVVKLDNVTILLILLIFSVPLSYQCHDTCKNKDRYII